MSPELIRLLIQATGDTLLTNAELVDLAQLIREACGGLSDRDREVIALDDLSTGDRANLDGTGIQLLEGTILDPETLDAACAGAGRLPC